MSHDSKLHVFKILFCTSYCLNMNSNYDELCIWYVCMLYANLVNKIAHNNVYSIKLIGWVKSSKFYTVTKISDSTCLDLAIARTMMVYQGLSRTIKDYQGQSRTVKGCHGLSRTIKDCQELSWTVMDYHGLSGTDMDCHELSWTILD